MRTRWVSFDCFGTLIDWRTGFSHFLKPLAGDRTADLMRAYHRFESRTEAQRPHRPYREVLTASLLLAAQETGVAMSERQARSLPEHWASLPVFADVEEALAVLRAEGCKLAVLTNCDEDLFAQTHRYFRQPFDLIVTAERVQDYKPSLTHFRYFSRTTEAELADWVHVACSWFHDIAPARELGIKRVWLDRDGSGHDAQAASARLTSAAALPATAKQLLEQP